MFGVEDQSVAKRRNRILNKIVQIMISYSTLSIYLWGKTVKTTIHILNKIPAKVVQKATYELWTDKFELLMSYGLIENLE